MSAAPALCYAEGLRRGNDALASLSPDDARALHAELAAQVQHHRDLYYNEETPELTDADYDALEARLRALEDAFPDLKTADSPTAVGIAAASTTADRTCSLYAAVEVEAVVRTV